MNREAAIAQLVALIKELTAVQKVAGRRDRLGHRKSDALLQGTEVLSQGAAWESSPVKASANG